MLLHFNQNQEVLTSSYLFSPENLDPLARDDSQAMAAAQYW